MRVDGVEYGPIRAVLDREQGANVWLTVSLREGKNREVRNVLSALGLTVNRLIRVSYGPFQLGELKPGEAEEVNSRVLKEQLGDKIIRLSGADFDAPVREREQESGPERTEAARKTTEKSRHGKFPPKNAKRKPERQQRRDRKETIRRKFYARGRRG
jgi:23S rRNA pseudouridine2605 synthase